MARRAVSPRLVFLLALGGAGCGGARGIPRPSGEATDAQPIDQCALAAEYTDTELITSFDQMGVATPCGGPDFACSFYLNHDSKHSPSATDNPGDNDCQHDILNGALVDESGLDESLSVKPAMDQRCGAPVSAMHFVAQNLSLCIGTNGRRGWGLGWEIDFGPSSMKAPIDASAWDGIAFWVKKGTGPSDGAIIVATVDQFATGGAEEIDPDTGAAVSCMSSEPVVQPLPDADSQKCDPFVIGVSLTSEWTFVPVRFADMRQKGFGVAAPDGLDTSAIARLQVLASAGNWDFWIDDVAFFRE